MHIDVAEIWRFLPHDELVVAVEIVAPYPYAAFRRSAGVDVDAGGYGEDLNRVRRGGNAMIHAGDLKSNARRAITGVVAEVVPGRTGERTAFLIRVEVLWRDGWAGGVDHERAVGDGGQMVGNTRELRAKTLRDLRRDAVEDPGEDRVVYALGLEDGELVVARLGFVFLQSGLVRFGIDIRRSVVTVAFNVKAAS